MANVRTYTGPRAAKIKTQADIVFCLDVTGSMSPCIEGLKREIETFAEGLQSAADVDFRLRLIAYRDLHDPTSPGDPWRVTAFTSSLREFKASLTGLKANGGGDHRGAESTLDALYLAIHSEWRPSKTHKTIVLLTDDNTHPTLHGSTYRRPDNDISRVIQDFQTLRHAMLFLVAPNYSAYQQIEQSMQDADRRIVAYFVPKDDKRYIGLEAVPWQDLLKMLGETVSLTSAQAAQED